MHTRLLKIIDYKTGGHQKNFAHLVGWSPAYLSKLIHGESGFGLQPILTLLTKFPEIDARWLLLGDGEMLSDQRINDLRRATLRRAQSILNLERYISAMSPEQLNRYEAAITSNRQPDFSDIEIAKWQRNLNNRADEQQRRLSDTFTKSLF